MNTEIKDLEFLENHIKKCRCCFTEFETLKDRHKITKKIRVQFFDLSQVEMDSEQHFSNFICGCCKGKLESFQEFKQDTIFKQQKLYESVNRDQYSIEFLDFDRTPEIKEEPISEKPLLIENQLETKKIEPRVKKIQCKSTKLKRKFENSGCEKLSHHKNNCFSCDICGYSTKFLKKISRHILRHQKRDVRGTFICYVCGKVLSTQSSLDHHIKYCHEIEEKTFVCYCGKKYKRKTELQQHTRLFHEKKFKHHCKICSKSYSSAFYYKEHLELHQSLGEKKYPCQVCGRSFALNSLLKSHQKIHAEPTISCKAENCTRLFFNQSHARKHHRRDHLCETRACEYCGKVISSLAYPRHIKEFHQGLEKIKCGVLGCTSAFVRRDNYRGHVRKSHADYLKSITEDELATIMNRKEFQV